MYADSENILLAHAKVVQEDFELVTRRISASSTRSILKASYRLISTSKY